MATTKRLLFSAVLILKTFDNYLKTRFRTGIDYCGCIIDADRRHRVDIIAETCDPDTHNIIRFPLIGKIDPK